MCICRVGSGLPRNKPWCEWSRTTLVRFCSEKHAETMKDWIPNVVFGGSSNRNTVRCWCVAFSFRKPLNPDVCVTVVFGPFISIYKLVFWLSSVIGLTRVTLSCVALSKKTFVLMFSGWGGVPFYEETLQQRGLTTVVQHNTHQ